MGYHAFLKGIFLTQGLNLCLSCLLHWQVGYLPLVPPGKPVSQHTVSYYFLLPQNLTLQ